MNTLMSLNNNNIVTLIQSNITLFEKFDKVYLFGSVLDDNKFPNDVDILLIYGEGSDEIIDDIDSLIISLQNLLDISVDLTVLSAEEEQDTQFLNRISPRYINLK